MIKSPLSLLVTLILLSLLAGCNDDKNQPTTPTLLSYSTKADSALHYYRVGWRQIMDEGRYAEAENSYRQAAAYDPDFLVGQAVLARLSLDTAERIEILNRISSQEIKLPEDEEKVFSVYRDLVRFTNLRERDPGAARAYLDTVLREGEVKLGYLVRKYPEEVYLKSEYLELLHSNRGAKIALDSFSAFTRERHADNPFLLGYAASLHAELGQFEQALQLAERLERVLPDTTAPKVYAVYADVYLAMDSLQKASTYADRAVKLDPRNLDASRLQTRINDRLAKLDD